MKRRAFNAALGSLVFAAPALAIDELYLQIRDIGDMIECTCGCSSTVSTCNMIGCHIRVPINEDIRAGLEAGKSKDEILAGVYDKYGDEVRVEPRREGFGMVGWAMPAVALIVGMAGIPFVVRKWRANAVSHEETPTVSDEVVNKYRAQIEKDLEEFE